MGSPAIGNFSLGPGGSTLSTSPGPSIGGAYGASPDLINSLFARMAARQEQDQRNKQAAFDQTMRERQAMFESSTGEAAGAARARQKKADDLAAEDRAMLTAPIPQKMISGPQIIPGFVDDPSKMNAIQRKAMLPNNATMAPSAPTPSAAQDLTADDMLKHIYGSGAPDYSTADPIQDKLFWSTRGVPPSAPSGLRG